MSGGDRSAAGGIRRLDQRTVERIAAGEVVERPASVVKELVENALDAGASRVSVAVEAGGTGGIRVSDDGSGMTREAVERAVEQHTTSKIRDVGDLEAGVGTLGFRGEALHAIGAVSRLTITTRPPDAAEGTELVLEGGEVTHVGPAGVPAGTTVDVQDLFYNVPARRKYLRRTETEFAHVNSVVTSYALATPEVAVTLEHDGRETFATTGGGDLRETVLAVYGREVADAMIDLTSGEDALPEGPLADVTGLVSHPETNRASRQYLTTVVNGRYVRADAVREAVLEGYGSELAPDRYPFAVVRLSLDPADVDVNVHPRKWELRFPDEAGVREQVSGAVRAALTREGLTRSGAPRGRSAPTQTEVSPTPPDGAGTGADPERGSGSANAADPDEVRGDADQGSGSAVGADTDLPRDDSDRGSGTADAPDPEGARDDSGGPTGDDGWRPRAVDAGSSDPGAPPGRPATGRGARTGGEASDSGSGSAGGPPSAEPASATPPSGDDRAHGGAAAGTDRPAPECRAASGAASRFSDATEQRRLGGDHPAGEYDTLPAMRILGQFRDTYVVAETGSGLLLVDQHAADERIAYERLAASVADETTTQALAEPVAVELTPAEMAQFEGRADALERLGFRAERTGDRTVEVRTVPALVAEGAGPDLVRDVLAAFVAGDRAAAETVEAAVDEVLADLACAPAVTANTSLTEGSIRDLLSALDDCENPGACPHGRPVLIELSTAELEDRFERDYPGHGGRRE